MLYLLDLIHLHGIYLLLLGVTHVYLQKQANHLFTLITQSWLKEDHKGRQRLLSLLGKLGEIFEFSFFTGRVSVEQ